MTQQAPSSASVPVSGQSPLALQRKPAAKPAAPSARPALKPAANLASLPFWIGLVASVAWLGVVVIAVAAAGPAHSFGGISLVDWAIGISAAASPVALIWMVAAYMQRAADIQSIADPLSRQLSMITSESGVAEARIRRFNHAIKEQLSLLRSAQDMSRSDLTSIIDRIREQKGELERFEHVGINQVKEIQDIIRRNMQQVEHLMEDKFTMLRVLDDKLVQSGDTVARQTESVRDQVTALLENIGSHSDHLVASLEQAAQTTRKLADTSHAQETTLLTAAENAADMLNGVSGKIDLSVARFLERASLAREETERMATALDTQTRALDEFSNTLPTRVGEAEAVLRGVADRLHASEKTAHQQAAQLSDKLSQQVDGLQQFLDRFSARLVSVDVSLDQRRGQLDALAGRIGSATSTFVQEWEKSIADLSERTGNTLLRFTTMSDDARKTAESVAAHFSETTAKYESAAAEARLLASKSNDELKNIIGEIADYLSRFESLREASRTAGEEVQSRAATAMENLQFVLERLLAARESTQSVGGTLVQDLHGAVDKNEQLISRLSDAAQAGARALGTAADAVSRQESELAERSRAAEVALGEAILQLQQQAQASEKGLRDQAMGLKELLSGTRQQMELTDQKMQSFAAQAIAPVQSAVQQIDAQAAQLVAATGKTIQQMSSLNEKLALTHEAANSNAQQTISRLEECNTAFMRQSNSLNDAAQTATVLIQKAGTTFGEHAGKILDTSHQMEQSLRLMTATTSALADQSAQIRSAMEQQNQRLVAGLTEAVSQLDTAGSRLQQVATTATTSADYASARFQEMTHSASDRLGASQTEMQSIAGKAETALAALGAHIGQQAASLSVVSEQVTEQYRALAAANENQRTQMVDLFDKLGAAHGQASEVAERTIARLNESLAQIQRNLGALSDQSQTTVGNVRTASSGFADQAGLLLQNAQQAEQQARTVLSVTASLQEQARQLREALQGEGERAGEILSTLLGKIAAGGSDLREFGTSTEAALFSLHSNLSQQGAALNSSMQQIADRQRSLTTALDAQRDVINGLLSRLNLAQDETASTAERTAVRLTDGTQQIVKQMESIAAQAQSTLSSVQAAGAGFANEAGTLGLQAQKAEQQMHAVLSVTAGMQEQARNLREAMQSDSARIIEHLTGVIAQLDNTNERLKQQSVVAIGTMDHAALQFTTLTKASGEDMQKQAETLTRAAEQAETHLSGASEKIRSHLHLVSEASDQTERRTHQLADAAGYASDRLDALRETMSAADKDGQSILTQASARIGEVKALLQSELENLTGLSQASVRQVAEAAQSLATQSDVLRANLATSESALAKAAGLVREETTRLPSVIERNAASIQSATGALQEQSAATEAALVKTADRFISVTTTARESMTDEMRRISAVADEAGKTLRLFNTALAEQTASMQQSASQLSGGQSALVETANQNITQLTAASDRLTQLRVDATQAAEKLAREFDTIDQRAVTTGQRLAQAGESVSRNMGTLAEATQRAEAQILGASSNFREQFERIRSGLQGQVDDINRGLMQITAQLERTGNALRSTTVGTVADVERIAQRFDQTSQEASTQLIDKTARMRGATEEVAKLLSGFGDQLDVLLDRLSMAGDGIRRHEGDLVGQMQTALSHLGSIAERLESGRALATNVSEQTVARLDSVVDAIKEQMQGLTHVSQTAAGAMRGIGQVYGDQTQALNKNVNEAHGQVLTMNKSIDEMQQRTDRIRVSLKLQSEELMNSLEQILKSLSVTGDTLGDTVDSVLRQQAAAGLKKIG